MCRYIKFTCRRINHSTFAKSPAALSIENHFRFILVSYFFFFFCIHKTWIYYRAFKATTKRKTKKQKKIKWFVTSWDRKLRMFDTCTKNKIMKEIKNGKAKKKNVSTIQNHRIKCHRTFVFFFFIIKINDCGTIISLDEYD